MVELLHDLLLPVHLAVGACALVLFWIPALSRKGGRVHRAAGRWYVRAMTFIAVSGVVLAQYYLFSDRWPTGVFLLFLGVITGTSLWNGARVLRAKRDPARYLTAAHYAAAAANIAGGFGLIGLGMVTKMGMFYAFGPVGLVIGGGMLGVALRRPAEPNYWLFEHFGGMIGSGIAAHVAFLAFGAKRLFGFGLSGYAVLLWMTPVVAGVTAIVALNFYYRMKALRPAAPAQQAA